MNTMCCKSKNGSVELIPHVDFSPEEKRQVAESMVRSNLPVKAIHKIIQERSFKNCPNKLSFRKFRLDLAKAIDVFDMLRRGKQVQGVVVHPNGITQYESVTSSGNGVLEMHGTCIPNEVVDGIRTLRSQEYRIMTGYSKLVYRESRRWFKSSMIDETFGDFYDECVMAAMNAIYNYSKIETQFSTYLTTTIYNHMLHFVNERINGKLNQEDIDLVVRYRNMEKQINGPKRFDDICDLLNFSQSDRNSLNKAMGTIRCQSQITTDEVDSPNDFIDSFPEPEQLRLDIDQQAAIANAPLTEWERTVLEAFIASEGRSGCLSEIAGKTINPKTNKPYSRASAGQVLASAFEKVQMYYKQGAAA